MRIEQIKLLWQQAKEFKNIQESNEKKKTLKTTSDKFDNTTWKI